MTEWRSIPGYEGRYEVSDHGQVRSVDRTITFRDGRVRHYVGKVLRQYPDEFGYLKVTLKKQDAGTRIHVHVLVALTFIGPRPAGMQVCHNDGDRLDNRPGKLRYDTPAGNAADTDRHGRRNPRRKLTNAEIEAIRQARGRLSGRELAVLFSTSPAHVSNIQSGNRRTGSRVSPLLNLFSVC